MKMNKGAWIAVLAVVGLVAAAAGLLTWERHVRQARLQEERAAFEAELAQAERVAQQSASKIHTPSDPAGGVQETVTAPVSATPQTQPVENVRQSVASNPPGRRAPATPKANAPAISEPEAREALNFVGTDPVAEDVWIGAINDPKLTADERQNLIEDLNENGLSDPNNPTQADLPLIESRLALIEELAPVAMDDVNAAAFQEAYKDLMNMYTRLTGP